MSQGQKIKNSNNAKEKLKLAASLFGGIVTFVAAILYVFADKVFDASGLIYKYAINITIGGYIIVFFSSFITLIIFKNRSTKIEIYEEVLKDFNESCSKANIVADDLNQIIEKLTGALTILSQDIEKEKNIITEIEIGQFVLNGRSVIDLEASVGNYDDQNRRGKIYIQSSLFVLEKGPLEKTILWNLRKGVKYIYIIPNDDTYINEYYEMLCDWYRAFTRFLLSKDDYVYVKNELENEKEHKKFWSREYQQIFDQVGKLWRNTKLSEKEQMEKINDYQIKCKTIFSSLIETHVDEVNEFYITVAAYEVKRNNWEVIIKLPTQNANKEYYAFQMPTENNSEIINFVHMFQSRYKSCNYEPNNMSTLGGKLELDYSRIFY